MNPELTYKLRCPAQWCGGKLNLAAQTCNIVHYDSGPLEEVREGLLDCPQCGRVYPIAGYVPSFDQLFSPDLKDEADYWSKWYGTLWARGYKGFFDSRAPKSPLLAEGIETQDPSTLEGKDLAGNLAVLADHPLLRDAKEVLDMGCGTGWSSLYLARKGHSVVAFDPSAANMRLAKLYAIEQGVYIEYVAAGLGYLDFQMGSFDAAVGLHAIHHVPGLRGELARLRDWLRGGGAIALDEHIRDNPTLAALGRQLDTWARREIYPSARTLGDEFLQALPQTPASTMEGVGCEEVIGAVLSNFTLESMQSRYVSLDFFSFIYYLCHGQDRSAYDHAAEIIGRLYSFWMELFPMGAEYVTLVASKGAAGGDSGSELAQRALMLARHDVGSRPGDGPALASLKSEHALLYHQLTQSKLELEEARRNIALLEQNVAELEGWARGIERHTNEVERWARTMQRALRARSKRVSLLTRLLKALKRSK
jgi:SAM-dependent methyltransferase